MYIYIYDQGYGMMVAHHQLFLRGMVTGFKMRIQVMAAVHAKASPHHLRQVLFRSSSGCIL